MDFLKIGIVQCKKQNRVYKLGIDKGNKLENGKIKKRKLHKA